MRVFSFKNKEQRNLKVSARNKQEIDYERSRKQQLESEYQRRLQIESDKDELHVPIAIRSGDPDFKISNNPNAQPLEWHFIHHDQLGRDERGESIAANIKQHIKNNPHLYREVDLGTEQYGDNEEMLRAAPGGMKGYIPLAGVSPSRTRTTNTSIEELSRLMNLSETKKRLKSTINRSTSANLPEFDPEHPLNLIANHGGKAFKFLFTDQMPYTPAKPGEDLCICGSSPEMHTDSETAKQRSLATGETMRTHRFTPQTIYNKDGQPINADKFRLDRSPLRRAAVPDGDKLSTKIVDQGLDRFMMPVVEVGAGPRELTAIRSIEKLKPNGSIQTRGPGGEQEVACTHCVNGITNPFQSNHAMGCRDCAFGQHTYKEDSDEQGNKIYTPITVGLGDSRMKYLNAEDCPPCPECNGNKVVNVRNVSSAHDELPCGACEGTGKDLSKLNGFNCNNCATEMPNVDSQKSMIYTTPDNFCPHCQGKAHTTKKVELTKKPGVGQKGVTIYEPKENNDIKYMPRANTFLGNPSYLVPMGDLSAHQTGSGMVGFKAHGDANCTECHGNDEYRTASTNRPCSSCRVAGFDDPDHIIMPNSFQMDHGDHFKIPLFIYQKAMKKAFPDDDTNPHNFLDKKHMSNKYEGVDFYDHEGKTIPNEHLIGLIENGIQLPQKHIDEFRRRSAINHSSRNAKFCAASADAEDMADILSTHFREFPMIVPGLNIKPKSTPSLPSGEGEGNAFGTYQRSLEDIGSAINKTDDERKKTTQTPQEIADTSAVKELTNE